MEASMIVNPSSTIAQPSSLPSQKQNSNPNPNSIQNPASDLPTTLSSLKSLISLCHQTLHSFNPLPPKPSNDRFVPCPYNPHHLMPPESLFRHTLYCPSPLDVDPPNYQNTLEASSLLHHQRTQFTIHDSSQELCFSLDDYLKNVGSASFCYQDCPGVVSSLDVDSGSTKRTFTLPRILAVECANVVNYSKGDDKKGISGFDDVGFRLLGSDFLFIRREIENWSNYECVNMYSYNIICSILGSRNLKESDLKKWVIVNSPRFGIVIDTYMRDHIFLLLSLCLKAIIREASNLKRDSNTTNFRCPVFAQVMTWLAYQLSVLYGQVNGKLFALNIFKQCILESSWRMVLFSMEDGLAESCDFKVGDTGAKVEEPLEKSVTAKANKKVDETIDRKPVFVSQVAAAMAALYERSLLEEKIRRLRFSQPLTSYQRMAEHAYVSNRAEEERKKRPNYRPIIDHDGVPRQRPSNQEMNRAKTREELLAEERDYKRRRMSYRGKKQKRTTLQVMRDIIDEYMDEIKLAGGIGCFVKGDAGVAYPSNPAANSHTNNTMDINDRRRNSYDSFEATRDNAHYYRKEFHHDHDNRYRKSEDSLPRDYEQSTCGSHGHREYVEDRRNDVDREKRRSHDQRSNHRRSQEDVDIDRRPTSSSKSSYHDYRSHSVSRSHRRNMRHSSCVESLVQNAFGDRYDPSKSHDMYDDDVDDSGGCRYGR